MKQNNAQTEITVLMNLKADLIYEIDRLIEKKEAKKEFESNELSSNFFHLSAHISFKNVLNKASEKSLEQILFLSKENFTTN